MTTHWTGHFAICFHNTAKLKSLDPDFEKYKLYNVAMSNFVSAGIYLSRPNLTYVDVRF